MTAETLRRAASLMRSRAEAAIDGPWVANEPGPSWRYYGGQVRAPWISEAFDDRVCDTLNNDDAQHIASWHPAVALAVADWLDSVALFFESRADEEYFDLDGDPIAPEDTHAIGSALAVARAYLGESA